VRDELGGLFADKEFVEAFGRRGRRGWSPGRLAMVTVLQMAENLTDRAAVQRVRFDLSWKYCLGLELEGVGFDASVLSEFRTRVAGNGLEERVLDLLVAALKEKGLVKAGGKQRTDSTHVLAAVRELNRLGALTPEFGHRRDLDLDGPGERSPRGDEALPRRVQGGRGRAVPVEAGSDDQVGRR